MKKKSIMVVACAALIICASVFGTLAYLSDTTETVKNTFTSGKVNITLDEAKVDEMGNLVTDENGQPVDRVLSNTYKLVPGHTYIKDPTIHVAANSEDCYLFAKIDNDFGLRMFMDGIRESTSPYSIRWTLIDEENGIYAYNSVVKSSESQTDIPIIKTITYELEGNSTESDANSQLNFTAYAVQAEGFSSATQAWEATFGKSI